jgi:hypothetical protein
MNIIAWNAEIGLLFSLQAKKVLKNGSEKKRKSYSEVP